MAEGTDFDTGENSYYYNLGYKADLDEIEEENIRSTDYYYESEERDMWESFVDDLRKRKIKILKNRGWYLGSSTKNDIKYTFDKYKEENYGEQNPRRYKNEEKIFLEISKRFENEKVYYLWKNPGDNNLDSALSIAYQKYFKFNRYWKTFSDLVKEKEIKILKKEDQSGWFYTTKFTLLDNVKYTFEKYYNAIPEEEEMFREKNLKLSFSNNYPKIIDIYKRFVMENDKQLDNLLDHLLKERNLPGPEAYDFLIEEARRKYNFEKERYNENVRNFSNLSAGMKEKTRDMGKFLNEFILNLKPLVKEYNERNKARDEDLKSKIPEDKKPEWQKRLDREDELREKREKERQAKLEEERRKHEEILRQNTLAEEKRRTEELQASQKEIENLNSKILDASARYAANVGKLRVLEFRLGKLEKLQKRKTELQQKLRQKNLSIEKRQDILKEKTELNEKLTNIDKLQDQVADLKSKIPDPETFEKEQVFRRYELNKYKKMNDASIRQKNALLKSLEFEKMKQEIAIREEQRYQEEQRQKEELKQAKIIFLKEKKIAERKLDELNVLTRNKNSQIVEMKKMEQDLISQKKFLEEIKAMQESKLKEKKLQIENVKLKTLELQKEKLAKKQDTAEQQKLFADSIQRDIDELNSQKNILKNLSTENKKILESTKREISARQDEIEKSIKLNLESVKQKESKILAEESKIKLDVFQTLSDVKEQTTIKLDIEKNLQDLKDEIIRKQDVSDLLSDTIDKISNNEISEIENYNAFLESEIEFKKKLEKKI